MSNSIESSTLLTQESFHGGFNNGSVAFEVDDSGLSKSPNNPSDAINIVVIGCGYAGALLSKHIDSYLMKTKNKTKLTREIKLIVIDRHPMVWLKVSSIRATLDQNWEEKSQIPIRDILHVGEFIQGNVTRVDKITKQVLGNFSTSENLFAIHYDILICASGSYSHCPSDILDSIQTKYQLSDYLQNVRSSIDKSSSIVIVGGGLTSIEYAAEIRSLYPSKKITIISASSELMMTSIMKPPKRFTKKLLEKLKRMNVEVLLNERVIEPSFQTISQSKQKGILQGKQMKIKCDGEIQKEIECDLLIWAGSWRLNNTIYPIDWLNDIGELDIHPTYQLKRDKHVFAFGDITSSLETKQAYHLISKVSCVGNNIISLAKSLLSGNQNNAVLKFCKNNYSAEVHIPFGPNDGISLSSYGILYTGKNVSKSIRQDLLQQKFKSILLKKPL